jgi:hypothetical protein
MVERLYDRSARQRRRYDVRGQAAGQISRGNMIGVGRVDDDLAAPLIFCAPECFDGGERQREQDDVGLDGVRDRPRNYRAAEFLDERRQRVSAPCIGDRDIDAGAAELARQGGADIS